MDKQSPSSEPRFEHHARLNLRRAGGILKCHGRILGDHYTEKLVEHCHNETLHGGVSPTMTKVREIYWIPRLRRLVKRAIKRWCFGCRRFHAIPFPNPQPGKLPKDRTEGDFPSRRSRLCWPNKIPKTRKERRQTLYSRIRMLLDSRPVPRAKNHGNGGIHCNIQMHYCKERTAQESLFRQRKDICCRSKG